MTQRIEPSFEKFDFQELNLLKIWLKELNLFFSLTQKIAPFFPVWLTELNLFLIWVPEFNSSKKKKTQRIELFKKKEDSKNWTLFVEYDSQNWSLFLNMSQRIEPFSNMTQSIKPFPKMGPRIKPFFWHEPKNCSSFLHDPKMTQRIDFFNMTLRIELFFNMTLTIEPFFDRELNHLFNMRERDTISRAGSPECKFDQAACAVQWTKFVINSLIHLWEDTSFVLASSCVVVAQCLVVDWWQDTCRGSRLIVSLSDSKKWTFFSKDDSNELNPRFNMTQRIELSS